MGSKKVKFSGVFLALALALAWVSPAPAQEALIRLQQPDFTKGKTVLQAMKDRKSDRVYGSGDLSLRQLSEVLWAAAGANRPLEGDKMGRTAPSGHNDQAVDTYAFTKAGVYKYDHLKHELNLVLAGDKRQAAGVQSYVATAPLNLIFVADLSKITADTVEDLQEKINIANTDVGHMSENVYLYSASAGLNVICRNNIEPEALSKLLNLSEHYLPILGVTVGLPK